MAKQINCSICLYRGDTVAMALKGSFFECPECGAQTYDNDSGDDAFIRVYQRQSKEYISRSLQPGTHIVGGGDSTGKPKNEAMKKPTLARLKFNMDSPRSY